MRGAWFIVAIAPLLLAACAPPPARSKPVEMVAMPPPTDSPQPLTAPPPPDPDSFPVAVGGIATLAAGNVKNFSKANANIDVRLTPDGKKFIIAGKTAGRCDLVLFFRDGTEKILKVNVSPAE